MSVGLISVIFGIVGLMAIALTLYTPDKSRAQIEAEYATPPSIFVWACGIRLHVRESGPVTGPAVVMLHGFASSLFTWEPWANALSDKYRIIRYDLPGFALTGPDPTGDYSDERGLEVLAALMDVLSVQQASLVGNSMGGKLAWMFAAKHPERVLKLILISPDGFANHEFRYGMKTQIPLFARLLPDILPAFIVRMTLGAAFGNPAAITKAMLERYRDLMLAPGNRAALIARMAQIDLERPEAILARITAPTLLLWGTKDIVIPAANATEFRRSIQGSHIITFPTLGHIPQEEAPGQSLAPARAFLDC